MKQKSYDLSQRMGKSLAMNVLILNHLFGAVTVPSCNKSKSGLKEELEGRTTLRNMHEMVPPHKRC